MDPIFAERTIAGRACRFYGSADAPLLLLQPSDEHDLNVMDQEYSLILKGCTAPFCLVTIRVSDWNSELSPWEAPPVFGSQSFGSGASATLRYIEEDLLPALAAPASALSARRIILGGYSLAGLFALWASYNSTSFHAVAAASPSVWFPGWPEYIRTHEIGAEHVYMSLGDREAKTRNQTMARVAANIQLQYDVLRNTCDCALEWNPGNHFREPDARMAKAFLWTMQRLAANQDNDGSSAGHA